MGIYRQLTRPKHLYCRQIQCTSDNIHNTKKRRCNLQKTVPPLSMFKMGYSVVRAAAIAMRYAAGFMPSLCVLFARNQFFIDIHLVAWFGNAGGFFSFSKWRIVIVKTSIHVVLSPILRDFVIGNIFLLCIIIILKF